MSWVFTRRKGSLLSANNDFYRAICSSNQLLIAVRDKYGEDLRHANADDPLVDRWYRALDRVEGFAEANEYFDLCAKQESLAQNRVVLTPADQYLRLAGEIEARDTQSRRHLSPAQRGSSPPYQSQCIPFKDVIIRHTEPLPWARAIRAMDDFRPAGPRAGLPQSQHPTTSP